jgi:transposase InsO family protein
LVKLARQKPRYGYRRLHALLERRGHEVNVKRVYRLYAEEGLAVRRRKRKRLVRDRFRGFAARLARRRNFSIFACIRLGLRFCFRRVENRDVSKVEFRLSEHTACKLLGVERSSYRYEPRPDRNGSTPGPAEAGNGCPV